MARWRRHERIGTTGLRLRAIIEDVQPQVDAGAIPIKRAIGDDVSSSRCVHDGQTLPRAVLRHRRIGETQWVETEMTYLVNESLACGFCCRPLGRYDTRWLRGQTTLRVESANSSGAMRLLTS